MSGNPPHIRMVTPGNYERRWQTVQSHNVGQKTLDISAKDMFHCNNIGSTLVSGNLRNKFGLRSPGLDAQGWALLSPGPEEEVE